MQENQQNKLSMNDSFGKVFILVIRFDIHQLSHYQKEREGKMKKGKKKKKLSYPQFLEGIIGQSDKLKYLKATSRQQHDTIIFRLYKSNISHLETSEATS